MTLTDIIAKITLFAKRIIVNDNSSSALVTVNQSGSGDAIYANGKIKASDSIFADQSFLSQTGIFTNYEGNDYVKLDSSDDSIRFYSNNTEMVTILTSGNLGIGTNAPAARLHVNGPVRLDVNTSIVATAGSVTLPSNPVGFIVVNIQGTDIKIPYYAT